jgi:murein biosynthesis integral membrane protein MurJ
MAGKWFKAGLVFGLVILIGRISGLIRELLIAHRFGISDIADQLIILLSFPDVLTGMLGTGALVYTLVPQFKTLKHSDVSSFYLQSLTGTFIVFCLIAALSTIFASHIAALLAPGFSPEKMATVQKYIPLFSLMIPLTALASVSTSWHHSKDNYFLPGLGALIVNTLIICGILVSSQLASSVFQWVAMALLLGGLLRFASQHLSLHRHISWKTPFNENHLAGDLGKRYIQAVLSGSLFLSLPVLARTFVSREDGAVATFNYAIKLAELPMGVAISVIPVILLPRMAAAYKTDETGAAEALSKDTIYANLALSLSIGVPGAWFATTIVEIVYGRGDFVSSELATISALVAIALLCLPAHGMLNHFLSVLHATKKTTLILFTAVITSALFYAISYLLYDDWGLPVLMMALYLSYFLGALILALTTKHSLEWNWPAVGVSWLNLRIVTFNIVLLAFIWLTSSMHPQSILFDVILGTVWGSVSLAGAFAIYVADKKVKLVKTS